jgi:hypothetical protein
VGGCGFECADTASNAFADTRKLACARALERTG